MFFPLQAVSADGEIIIFNIQDCPKLVDDELFYLANKPGTPLLRKDTILRGSDMFTLSGRRIFEGDVLRDEGGVEYIVQFMNGFKLRGQDGRLQTLNHSLAYLKNRILHDITETAQWYNRYFKTPKCGKMRYMVLSQGVEFNLFDIMSASAENALIYRGGGRIAAFEDIGQFTGIKCPTGQGYFYGQRINGFGTVSISQGDPGVMTPEGFKCFGNADLRKKLEKHMRPVFIRPRII